MTTNKIRLNNDKLLNVCNCGLNIEYIIIIGQIISIKMTITIDSFFRGQFGDFNVRLSTVPLKFNTLFIPERTNIVSKKSIPKTS